MREAFFLVTDGGRFGVSVIRVRFGSLVLDYLGVLFGGIF